MTLLKRLERITSNIAFVLTVMIQSKIVDEEQTKLREIDEIKLKIAEIENDSILIKTKFDNQLTGLNTKYEKTRLEYNKWKNVMANISDISHENERNVLTLTDQIRELHSVFCRKKSRNIDEKPNIEVYLDEIFEMIKTMKQIIRIAEDTLESDLRSDIAVCSESGTRK